MAIKKAQGTLQRVLQWSDDCDEQQDPAVPCIDDETRGFFSNHTALLEGFLLSPPSPNKKRVFFNLKIHLIVVFQSVYYKYSTSFILLSAYSFFFGLTHLPSCAF